MTPSFFLRLLPSMQPAAIAATIYWSGIRAVVFALSSEGLAEFTGGNFLIPCTELFARSTDVVTVVGPLLLDEAREVHRGYWKPEEQGLEA